MSYAIVYKKHFYAGTFNVNENWQVYVPSFDKSEGMNADWMTFDSKNDAEEAMEEISSGPYYLAHGEHSRPTFKVLDSNHCIVKGAVNRLVNY